MYKNTFLFFLLCICVNQVSGENITDVDVSSPIFTNSINEAKPIHILQNEEIKTNQSLGDNLKGLSGISNADYGIAVGQPAIRGLSGNRTRVFKDNIGVNDLSQISGDHIINVDLNNISHIEIIKGPSSIFSHGGVSGGIVNIISDAISKSKFTDEKIRFDYTSVNNGFGHNFLLKKNLYNTNIFFSINNQHLDNYSLPDGSLFDEDHPTKEKSSLANSDFKNQNINLGLSFPRAWGYLGVLFENTDGVYGLPYHAEEEEEHEEEEEAHRLFTRVESETYTIRGLFNKSKYFNSLEYSFTDSNSFLKEHEEDGSASLDNNSKALAFKFNLDDDLYEKRLLLQYERIKSPMTGAYLPSSNAYNKSISYFLRTKSKPFVLDFAGRYETNSRDSTYQRYGDSALSFGTSYSHKIGDSLRYSVGYAHVSRSPSIAELFASGSHGATQRYERGNMSMSREVSRNIDLGLQYNINDIDINLNLYRNSINGYIYLKDEATTTAGKTDANWSQKDAVIQGYEISMSRLFNIGDGELLVTISRDDISGVFEDDTYIPRINPAKNVLSFEYENTTNDIFNLDFVYTESQGDMSSIETKTNSHIDLNLGYSKKITLNSNRDLLINLYGNNLLNKTMRNHASLVKDHVPLPGANFGVTMSLQHMF